MNTDVMFSSKTDMWATPQYFFDELNNEFGFEIDVCATDENAKCGTYYTKEQDGYRCHGLELAGVIHHMAEKLASG